MCRTIHLDFYHQCGHVQKVEKPSTNPKCSRLEETIWYRSKGDEHGSSGWCKRCYRSSLFANPAYGVEVPGPVCWYIMARKESVEKVKAMVTLGPLPFKNYDNITLWERRFDFMVRRNDLINEPLWKIWRKQEEDESEAGLRGINRTFFFTVDSIRCEADPHLYLQVTRASLRQFGFDSTPEEGSEEEKCLCQFTIPWEDIPAEDACQGGPVAMMPCAHFFGMQCIRRSVEEYRNTTCPTCRAQWKIQFEPLSVPFPGWLQAYNRYCDARENPVEWRQKSLLSWLRYWYVRVVAYVVLALLFTVLFSAPPWASGWSIWTLAVGALAYSVTTSLPIVAVGENEFFAFNWVSYLVLFVWRICSGAAFAWRVAVALGYSFW